MIGLKPWCSVVFVVHWFQYVEIPLSLSFHWYCQFVINHYFDRLFFTHIFFGKAARWKKNGTSAHIPCVSLFCNPQTVARYHTIPEQGKNQTPKQSIPEQHGLFVFNPIFNPTIFAYSQSMSNTKLKCRGGTRTESTELSRGESWGVLGLGPTTHESESKRVRST